MRFWTYFVCDNILEQNVRVLLVHALWSISNRTLRLLNEMTAPLFIYLFI